MNYNEFISTFSKSIFDLSSSNSNLPITEATKKNLSVYKVNLLYGLKERLEEDFPKVYLYLEENNFTYLVREFIKRGSVESANYYDVAAGFLGFIKESKDIHADEYVHFLGIIDSFWSFGFCAEDLVPKGVLTLWLSLEIEDEEEITIKLDELFRLKIQEQGDSKAFSLKPI
jgi:hypothetical protein